MRLVKSLSVFVVAFAFGHTVTQATDFSDRVTRITPVSVDCPPEGSTIPEPIDFGFSGFKSWQAVPEYGLPGSAAPDVEHFVLPMHHYTNWYRPRAATLTKARRCEAQPYHPRGFGNLFARPCDSYRMEYKPYSLNDHNSQYGPVYIARQPDQRCDHHGGCELHGQADECDCE